MPLDQLHVSQNIWRPQPRLSIAISPRGQINNFNDTGGIAVYIDTDRSIEPDIEISGSQNAALSFWETSSASGFVSKPKFAAGLLTLRFVMSGRIVYRLRHGEVIATPSIAALTGFEDLSEVRASCEIRTVSATLGIDALAAAQAALTGQDQHSLPALQPIADMGAPGMGALFGTIRLVQRRLPNPEGHADLMLPLLQEIVSYQLLSAWPKQVAATVSTPHDLHSRHLRFAIDYIVANLSTSLTLADIAAAAGTSVRSLQSKFKQELGRTPIQFIIERRLSRAHDDLISSAKADWSIADIARQHGFVHLSDFSQRYRREYGNSPTETRRQAALSR
ncbi:helix-turn-helix transcriptional regulator [Methylobacterium sp. J-067]|uniref:helix-turn-helix transcriptional regulator n=1 Tax=Methylobacterium sp. J-067 TaxID=2836648 RepID=UPI001FBB0015|nr:AraC family transcriptional regulator [Methylobacterium sp. J-067]MCJ2026914.1 helix-turn-helix transcriptional regulator [Methylobacterium sp. J-067]